MTDINKQMEKKAHDWAMTGKNVSDYNTLFYSFKKGYESALHSSRWRKVSDELPTVGVTVIAKTFGGKYILAHTYMPIDFNKEKLGEAEWVGVSDFKGSIVEWKPID